MQGKGAAGTVERAEDRHSVPAPPGREPGVVGMATAAVNTRSNLLPLVRGQGAVDTAAGAGHTHSVPSQGIGPGVLETVP